MRVLFLGRDDLLKNIGGDRIQVEQTKQELEKLGVSVDLKTGRDFECAGYDLIHVFQLDWNMDCFYQVKKAKDSGLPVVLSAIHHSVAEVKRFDEEYVFDFRRVSRVLFTDQFNRDLFKEFYRSVLSLKRLAKVDWWLFVLGPSQGKIVMQCPPLRMSLASCDVSDCQTKYECF